MRRGQDVHIRESAKCHWEFAGLRSVNDELSCPAIISSIFVGFLVVN